MMSSSKAFIIRFITVVSEVVEEELIVMKKEYIDNEVAESVKEHGYQPSLFTQLLQKAIGKLRGFIEFVIFYEYVEKDENGNPIIHEDAMLDITPAALLPREKGPYPSSELELLEVKRLSAIDDKLKAGNRKVYAIEKDRERLQ